MVIQGLWDIFGILDFFAHFTKLIRCYQTKSFNIFFLKKKNFLRGFEPLHFNLNCCGLPLNYQDFRTTKWLGIYHNPQPHFFYEIIKGPYIP